MWPFEKTKKKADEPEEEEGLQKKLESTWFSFHGTFQLDF